MFNFLRRTCLWILLTPALTFGAGVLSNQLVLWANHDTFPVLVNDRKFAKFEAAQVAQKVKDDPSTWRLPIPARVMNGAIMLDDVHCRMDSTTHLNFLADVWDLGSIYSIGDFMLYAGVWMWDFAPFVYLFAVTAKLCRLQENQ
jgi:hypothetical protein